MARPEALVPASLSVNGPAGLKPADRLPLVAVAPHRSQHPSWQPSSESDFSAVPVVLSDGADTLFPDVLANPLGPATEGEPAAANGANAGSVSIAGPAGRLPAAPGATAVLFQDGGDPAGGGAGTGSAAPENEPSLPSDQAALEAMTGPPIAARSTSAPSAPALPLRPRTTGPRRPARPPGSLFGGGMVAGASGGSFSAGCGWVTFGEGTVNGNTVDLGIRNRPENGTQPVDVHGASMLLPAAPQYTIYLDVDLSTWDSYNQYQGPNTGTGYWDSFSVSVTGAPYPELAWNEPVPLPFTWGGQLNGDNQLDQRTGPVVITVNGNPVGSNYLNVVLDTFTQPDADPRYPSWGNIIVTKVTAEGINFAPGAEDDAYAVLHDTTLEVDGRDELDVLFNDCNLDGDPLTARLVGSPPPGTLAFNSDGTFTYTPTAGFFGQVSFMYVANDGTTDSNVATVTIDVFDDPPVAQADTYDLPPNTSLIETAPGVLGNDYDPEGDSITAVEEPGYGPYNGTIDYFNPDGSFQYTPNPDFVGTDTFAYRVFDGIRYSLSGLVTLVVSAEERVNIASRSRGGDKVVSAQSTIDGLPGGTKTLHVQAIPHNAVVTLTIRATAGTGSAVFQDTQTNTKQLMGAANGRYTVTIEGRNISSQQRNMLIEARINDVVRGMWDFTVFMVSAVTRFTTGHVNDVLPESVMNPRKDILRDRIREVTRGTGRLGHRHVDEQLAWGGIVIRGRISPSGMNPGDFNRDHSRTESFNWDRKINGRLYDGNGCIRMNAPPEFRASQSRSDDLFDWDEDLIPSNDIATQPNELYIWTFDLPRVMKGGLPADGDVNRVRWQYTEVAEYAGVRVSHITSWYWRSSQHNPAGDATFRENAAVPGDNVLGTPTTPLTWNLGPTTIPDFTVTASAPPTAIRGQPGVNATITGTLLNSGAPCQPLVYWIRETPGEQALVRTVFALTITNPVTPTQITGTFNVPANAQLGVYSLKVFIGDKARTLGNVLTITP